MSTTQNLLKELAEEALVTRKMLERIPSDKLDWTPHVKSMPVKQLAGHIAELPGWISMILSTEGLNFAAQAYKSPEWSTNSELLDILDDSLNSAKTSLEKAGEEDLLPNWVLSNGDQILMTKTKGEFIRHSMSQIVHHRAQLGVYLRLLDVPIPGSYGPSADDPAF
ncbi:DinB family protein [Pedobacter cryoconitis]|uniref:Putative damage-inducible protein DinB n=1 Tax=Pedobacter cryoconitis TaxID=188932 RepID=A0A7X0MLQ4_9SPHI|nr:DinB family protein [Pedobacter cryoconitis]MBB6501648.1 putative damage-inducible protein DinB [Pedobacter cryoconitis]